MLPYIADTPAEYTMAPDMLPSFPPKELVISNLEI